MSSDPIPRGRWREELDSFSRQHEGWLVRVTVTGGDGRTRTESADLPLQGISADSPRTDAVAIIVGERGDDHVTHEIAHPVAIAIEHAAGGAERVLSIRAADGSTTKVEFRPPMGTGGVDGKTARED